MRKTLCVTALMLALCCPALAGEIPTPPAPQPHGVTVEEPTLNGVIPAPDESESLTQTVLELLAVLPSLL